MFLFTAAVWTSHDFCWDVFHMLRVFLFVPLASDNWLHRLFMYSSNRRALRRLFYCFCVNNKINSTSLRRSGASSSCSSYYSTSAAKAQLLSQMKDFTDNRERDEDDELTYKVMLTLFLCFFLTAWWRKADWVSLCCAETADGEPPQEAGSVEGSSERTAGGHQGQRTAGRGGVDQLHPVIQLPHPHFRASNNSFSVFLRLIITLSSIKCPDDVLKSSKTPKIFSFNHVKLQIRTKPESSSRVRGQKYNFHESEDDFF